MTEVMAGKDPRPVNGAIGDALNACIESHDETGYPALEAYNNLIVLLQSDLRIQREHVPLQDSVAMAREVTSYLYSKPKAIHVSGEMEHLVQVEPLSPAEIIALEAEILDEL
jgi:hypothetical protein